MVSDRLYRRMCMSGWQAQRYEQRLAQKRDNAEWQRDRKRLYDIMSGDYPQYHDRVPKGPLTRLSKQGLIRITEEFFPTLGVARYRIDFVSWRDKHEWELSKGPPRALDI